MEKIMEKIAAIVMAYPKDVSSCNTSLISSINGLNSLLVAST